MDNDNRKAYTDFIQKKKPILCRSDHSSIHVVHIDVVDEFPKTQLINIQNNPIFF